MADTTTFHTRNIKKVARKMNTEKDLESGRISGAECMI